MLKRGDSDFQWFKARTESLSSSFAPYQSKMSTRTAPLNAETSQPEERADNHLPPKSYADAVADTTSDDTVTNGHLHGVTSSLGIAGNTNGFPATQNGSDKSEHETKIVYEKYINDRGDQLTSVKTDETYSGALEHDRETAPREKKSSASSTKQLERPEKKEQVNKQQNTQLASGRQAGAGWERSAYVFMQCA